MISACKILGGDGESVSIDLYLVCQKVEALAEGIDAVLCGADVAGAEIAPAVRRAERATANSIAGFKHENLRDKYLEGDVQKKCIEREGSEESVWWEETMSPMR